MEFYIIKVNIWFGAKLYEAGECAKFDPADPAVQRLVAKEYIESTGTLVDASEPIPSTEETVQDITMEMAQEEVEGNEALEPEPEPEVVYEPEPEIKQEPKQTKKGRNK